MCRQARIRRYGASRNRYLSPTGFADFCCYFSAKPHWPRRQLLAVGAEIYAVRSLRVLVPYPHLVLILLRREQYERTMAA